MRIKEISIANYRSFGPHATIKFDSNVTALIGLNGIGKTNALEAVSRMKFFCDEVQSVIPKSAINKTTHMPPELRLAVEIDDEDCRIFNKELEFVPESRTGTFVFKYDERSQKTRMFLPEFLSEIMGKHVCFTELKDDLKKVATTIRGKVQMGNLEFAEFFSALDEYSKQYVPHIESLGQWVQANLVNPYCNGALKEMATKTIGAFFSRLKCFYEVFASVAPQIHLFQDAAEFPNAYSANEIESWNQSPSRNFKVALTRFLGAVGSDRNELIRAFREKNDSVRNDLQDRIQNNARKLIREFNSHYMGGGAEIDLNVKFDGDTLRFTISNASTPGSVLWSETSAGVRWYLTAFFELHQALRSRNAVILIDEPAIHLHVNAQKDVLSLLYQLASGTRYLVYTTHSPYMIDAERLGDVRVVVRDGETSSIRSLTGLENPVLKKDVLAPICYAIGCDMSANLSPTADKLNLIVEGLSDSCYMSAMLKLMVPDEGSRPFVIPGQGASSVPNLVSIMIGWGLKFKVVLDNDHEGKKTFETLKKKFGQEIADLVCFVKDSDNTTTEQLVSQGDYRIVCGTDYNPEDIREAKVAKSRRFSAMIDSGELVPDSETTANFRELFQKLRLIS